MTVDRQYNATGVRVFKNTPVKPPVMPTYMMFRVRNLLRDFPSKTFDEFCLKQWHLYFSDGTEAIDELLALSGDGRLVFRQEGWIDLVNIYDMQLIKDTQ